ncbi:MAG: helix-turn-helix domain-containing protein [Nitrospinota bacterium]
MGPAKMRRIREAVTALLSNADRDFLGKQTDKKVFAESLAWELRNSVMCSQREYEREVLPFVVSEANYIDGLRKRAIDGEKFVAEDIFPYWQLIRDFGRLIRDARMEMGLTQATLAERAHTTQPIVSRIERGSELKEPSIELLIRLAISIDRQVVLSLKRRKGSSV